MRAPHVQVVGAGRHARAFLDRAERHGVTARAWRRVPPGGLPRGEGEAPLVLLALPQERVPELDPEVMAGRVVIDATNAWPGDTGAGSKDGLVAGDGLKQRAGTSHAVADHLRDALVVKTLNHLSSRELATVGDDERALAVVGDHPGARGRVAALLGALGLPPVELGGLELGHHLEPGGVLFGVPHTAPSLRRAVRELIPRGGDGP